MELDIENNLQTQLSKEEKLEHLEKIVVQMLKDHEDKEYLKKFMGTVASWTEKEGAKRIHWKKATTLDNDNTKLKNKTFIGPKDAFMQGLPDIKKRTPQERLDSLTKRLVQSMKDRPYEESLIQQLSQDIQLEYIKRGAYISTEQIRQLAGFYLQKAENEMRRNA